MTTSLPSLGIVEGARLLRAGQLSSVEWTRGLLDRIARLDAQFNAFIAVDRDGALAAAREADDELARGIDRGPLHGVPYAVKDIIDVAGSPTTCHSKIMRDHVPAQDAAVITRLREAGAVNLGKLALHEFAIGGPSFDLPWPPARNPWNRAVHPGGSSSGSGVALAAGFAPLTLGTDTAGSIRNPASSCGVIGLKPTYDLVSTQGVFPLSKSLDHVGPMTRSVADCAVALTQMIDSAAAARIGCARSGLAPFADLAAGVTGLRVGVIDAFYRGPDVDAEIVAATDAAVATLARLGALTRSIDVAPFETYRACNRLILNAESNAVHGQWLRTRPGDYGALGRERVSVGAKSSAADYIGALADKARLTAEMLSAMADCDVIVTASSLQLPVAIDDEAAIKRTYERHCRPPFNLTGLPALSIPIGVSRSGLPIGFQIVSRHFGESVVFRVAQALERAIEMPACPVEG